MSQPTRFRLKPAASAFVLVLAGLGLASAGALAMRPGSPVTPRASSTPPANASPPSSSDVSVQPAVVAPSPSPFLSLPPVEFVNLNTDKAITERLYTKDGQVDAVATERLNTLLLEQPEVTTRSKSVPAVPAIGVKIAERTLQLIYRAAYHFRAERVEIVSAYRAPSRRREGPHASGRAVDFKLAGTKAAALASYLRTLPRVGVGVYTHPKTQYVHLDVREESFHWLDASPPGRKWRERSLGTRALRARDAAYSPAQDLPENLSDL